MSNIKPNLKIGTNADLGTNIDQEFEELTHMVLDYESDYDKSSELELSSTLANHPLRTNPAGILSRQ